MSEQRTVAVLAGLALLAGAAACGQAGNGPAAGGTGPAAAAATGSAGGGTASAGPSGASSPAAPAASAAPANGVEALPAGEIVDRSVAALKGAGSVRITGKGTSGGQSVTFDLAADTDGNCAGTMGLSGQGSFRLVKLGTQLWVKPDAVFWLGHGGPAAQDLVGDKYLKTTTDNTDFSAMGTVCDLDALGGSLADRAGVLAVGGTATVAGVPAVTVTGDGEDGRSTLAVATRGAPYPLQVERTGGVETGRVDLKEFGVPVPTTTPSPAETVDLDALNGGGTDDGSGSADPAYPSDPADPSGSAEPSEPSEPEPVNPVGLPL
ncbi:hypothetical protein [Kitasatospora sp. NBC_01539]|uniref:hypothetical protein n=1 Tax=Kitasatospora sp. NBC_01539 TaxID=2903577 RepID=UPI0038602338